jgi:hypothetical protein
MRYWEIVLIERGYYHRNVLQYQLQRLQAYGSIFAFSGDKKGKGPDGWFPLYFDRYKDDGEKPVVSKETENELLAELNAINGGELAQHRGETTVRSEGGNRQESA